MDFSTSVHKSLCPSDFSLYKGRQGYLFYSLLVSTITNHLLPIALTSSLFLIVTKPLSSAVKYAISSPMRKQIFWPAYSFGKTISVLAFFFGMLTCVFTSRSGKSSKLLRSIFNPKLFSRSLILAHALPITRPLYISGM